VAYLWAVMMLCWLGGLLFGIWWVWPLISARQLTGDLVLALAWLIAGGAAWLLALNIGLQHYWRR
jgi:hypothetical protein